MTDPVKTRDGGPRYRVVQWATGNVGARALRRAIEHPDLDLVGLWVHSPAKAGRDAADLIGLAPPHEAVALPPTGVLATNSLDEVIALRPDCVLYMPHLLDYDEVCRILASGANIVTTRTEFQHPSQLPADVRARVEAACAAGNSSIHGTGSSPGFVTEQLPFPLLVLQRRLDFLSIDEFADCSSRNSPDMLFDIMGFGQPPADSSARFEHLRHSFFPSLQVVAEAIGLPLDDQQLMGEVAVAREDVHIAAGVVKAGTVAAQRGTIIGLHKGRPLMRFTANWFISADVVTPPGDPWVFRGSGWRVMVKGDCPLDVTIDFPVTAEEYPGTTPGLTANPPVNAVPAVCAAPPGIRTSADLPRIVARFA